jgi:hypothetical protein
MRISSLSCQLSPFRYLFGTRPTSTPFTGQSDFPRHRLPRLYAAVFPAPLRVARSHQRRRARRDSRGPANNSTSVRCQKLLGESSRHLHPERMIARHARCSEVPSGLSPSDKEGLLSSNAAVALPACRRKAPPAFVIRLDSAVPPATSLPSDLDQAIPRVHSVPATKQAVSRGS